MAHEYYSTACSHGRHVDCRLFCKWCTSEPDGEPSGCLCACHDDEEAPYTGYDPETEARVRADLRREVLRRGVPVGPRQAELLVDMLTATLARIARESS